MPSIRIQLTKRADGGAILRCLRPDGSVTWQTHRGQQAAFFPQHDLTHYAVESELGLGTAFYGLMAAGWDADDTGGKGPRGPLPPEAVMVEHIVGLLDVERSSGHLMSPEEFRTALSACAAQHQNWPGAAARALDDDAIARIRARRSELFGRWREVPEGGTLELEFGASEGA